MFLFVFLNFPNSAFIGKVHNSKTSLKDSQPLWEAVDVSGSLLDSLWGHQCLLEAGILSRRPPGPINVKSILYSNISWNLYFFVPLLRHFCGTYCKYHSLLALWRIVHDGQTNYFDQRISWTNDNMLETSA